jgi:hypothetical protein
MISDEDAKDLYCPVMFHGSKVNGCMCLGVKCMAWQWENEDFAMGHCDFVEIKRK